MSPKNQLHRTDAAAPLGARLITDPGEGARRFKAALTSLRRRKRFVPRREAGAYAAALRDLLAELGASVHDPRTGVELVDAFYRSDARIFEAADDSDGLIGDTFRLDARDLFQHYATRCDDKAWLARKIFDLLGADDYGVRDSVLDGAASYLPEAELRALAGRMWEAAEAEGGTRQQGRYNAPASHWLRLLEQVACQLNDPRLFEQARRAHSPNLGVAACIHIAAAWQAAGDPATALTWLDRLPPGQAFMAHERDQLLRAIHEQLGHHDQVEALVWRRFEQSRGAETLRDLLQVIGQERREKVVAQASAALLQAKEFSVAEALFLMRCGGMDDTARYVLDRWAQLDGDDWTGLVPLAEGLEVSGKWLAATTLYRALLDSILKRAKSPTYGHGARYLHRLRTLAGGIEAWEGVASHEEYLASLRVRHGRKTSFWALADTPRPSKGQRA